MAKMFCTFLNHVWFSWLQKEREAFEVIVENGKLVYKQSGMPVHTTEGSKWIFVLSTTRSLYVGKKKKGVFQHSSFLSGGATTAAGRLVASHGFLEVHLLHFKYQSPIKPICLNSLKFFSSSPGCLALQWSLSTN